MDRITVEVYLPAAQMSFDVMLPLYERLDRVTGYVSSLLSELSEGLYVTSGDATLCDRESGSIFNINMTVAELNLQNGSKLMLI